MTFAYQNGDIILDDVSLRVNKGDLIAIVGESGNRKKHDDEVNAAFDAV